MRSYVEYKRKTMSWHITLHLRSKQCPLSNTFPPPPATSFDKSLKWIHIQSALTWPKYGSKFIAFCAKFGTPNDVENNEHKWTLKENAKQKTRWIHQQQRTWFTSMGALSKWAAVLVNLWILNSWNANNEKKGIIIVLLPKETPSPM